MNRENKHADREVLPVCRSKNEAKRYYDRISSVYDRITGASERKFAEIALEWLRIENGETVLEIGFGTGHCLKKMAESVGDAGKVYGVDISPGMVRVTQKRLEKAGMAKRVELYSGDAAVLPYNAGTFDAVFMSFTLELFDTPEIPVVLGEVKRVLKTGGRIGIAAMSGENGNSLLMRLYEWAHMKWPVYIDCRPVYVERLLVAAGYDVKRKEIRKLFSLPVEIVVALK